MKKMAWFNILFLSAASLIVLPATAGPLPFQRNTAAGPIPVDFTFGNSVQITGITSTGIRVVTSNPVVSGRLICPAVGGTPSQFTMNGTFNDVYPDNAVSYRTDGTITINIPSNTNLSIHRIGDFLFRGAVKLRVNMKLISRDPDFNGLRYNVDPPPITSSIQFDILNGAGYFIFQFPEVIDSTGYFGQMRAPVNYQVNFRFPPVPFEPGLPSTAPTLMD